MYKVTYPPSPVDTLTLIIQTNTIIFLLKAIFYKTRIYKRKDRDLKIHKMVSLRQSWNDFISS